MDARIKEITGRLKAYDPETVILFGSAARGERDRFSDVDLVIVKRTRKRFLDRLKEVVEILQPNYALDVFVYTPAEFRDMKRSRSPFIERILRDCVILYEKPKARGQAVA
jgi:uncharacterized protein